MPPVHGVLQGRETAAAASPRVGTLSPFLIGCVKEAGPAATCVRISFPYRIPASDVCPAEGGWKRKSRRNRRLSSSRARPAPGREASARHRRRFFPTARPTPSSPAPQSGRCVLEGGGFDSQLCAGNHPGERHAFPATNAEGCPVCVQQLRTDVVSRRR